MQNLCRLIRGLWEVWLSVDFGLTDDEVHLTWTEKHVCPTYPFLYAPSLYGTTIRHLGLMVMYELFIIYPALFLWSEEVRKFPWFTAHLNIQISKSD